MTRNLADLQAECKKNNLEVVKSGKRDAKADYEKVLREFYWNKEHPGEPLPPQIHPQLSRNLKDLEEHERQQVLKDNNGWVSQEKINGCRCLLYLRKGGNMATSRRMSDRNYRYQELQDKLPHYRDLDFGREWDGTVIDGEVLMPSPYIETGTVKTRTVLQATAATLNCAPEKAIDIQSRHGEMILYAFDLLYYKGENIQNLPYWSQDPNRRTRYKLLQEVLTKFMELKPGYSAPDPTDLRAEENKPAAKPTFTPTEVAPSTEVEQLF